MSTCNTAINCKIMLKISVGLFVLFFDSYPLQYCIILLFELGFRKILEFGNLDLKKSGLFNVILIEEIYIHVTF